MIENNRIVTIDEIVIRLKENYSRNFDIPLDSEACEIVFMEHFCFPIANAIPEVDVDRWFRLINIHQAYDIIERMNLETTRKEIEKKVNDYVEKYGINTEAPLFMTMVRV